MPVVRQKLHLSPCSNFRGQLCGRHLVVNSTGFHLCQPSHFVVVPGVLQVLSFEILRCPGQPMESRLQVPVRCRRASKMRRSSIFLELTALSGATPICLSLPADFPGVVIDGVPRLPGAPRFPCQRIARVPPARGFEVLRPHLKKMEIVGGTVLVEPARRWSTSISHRDSITSRVVAKPLDLWKRCNFSVGRLHSTGDWAAPTVSAIVAPRAPSGFSLPTVVSRAV